MADSAITFTPGDVSAYYAARIPRLRQRGAGEWRGGCPIHGGKDPNFAVNSETGQWFCHSQCNRGGDIFELEMTLSGADFKWARQNVLDIVGRPTRQPNGRRRIVATYDYVKEQGQLLFQAVRYEPKSFCLHRPDESGGWIWNLNGIQPVLYRLPQVLAANQVYLVEGEKDVETLEAWGLVATCNPMGAGQWRSDYSKYIAGKAAVILPDNDQAGREHAVMIAQSVIRVAASVRIVELPGLPEKGDVTDWAGAGHTVGELVKLADGVPALNETSLAELEARWRPPKPAKPPERRVPFEVNDQGVFFLKDAENGSVEPVRLAARVDIVAKTRDERGDNWGRVTTLAGRREPYSPMDHAHGGAGLRRRGGPGASPGRGLTLHCHEPAAPGAIAGVPSDGSRGQVRLVCHPHRLA